MAFTRSTLSLLASFFLFAIAESCCLAQDIALIGRTSISATATDLSGENDKQENGTPQNRLGGHGSAIAWLGTGNKYVMLPDRGPDDGATSYRCRIQIVEIVVDPGSATPVTTKLLETHHLTTPTGENFLGRQTQFDKDHPERSLRLDPEGIRATKNGTFLISEEYGPTVREFDSKGRQLRVLNTPARYLIKSPGGTPEEELPPNNTSGRQNNRGWEGAALSDDGQKLYTIAQSPLIQDGGLDEKNKRVGINVRIWEHDLTTGGSREFLYQLDDKSLGCSDIEWISPNRLLVIERDGKPGNETKAKLLYEIDLSGATDISSIERLPVKGAPEGVRPVAKKLFIDLLAPKYGLAGDKFPEKIEGIAFGPKLADGYRVLIVASDNDFRADQDTEIYAFSVK
ncbi:MAG: esterase-like activity of phytase family protein [Schlesneria sp.]